MFDFGFGELLLLAVIALVVLGPERLPVVARLAGLWIRKARAQWNAVKSEMENELADDELRRNLRAASDAMREGTEQMRNVREGVASTARQMTRLSPPVDAPVAVARPPEAHPAPLPDQQPPALAASGVVDRDPAQLSLLDPEPEPAAPAHPSDRPDSDG